jgi:ribosomal protein L17
LSQACPSNEAADQLVVYAREKERERERERYQQLRDSKVCTKVVDGVCWIYNNSLALSRHGGTRLRPSIVVVVVARERGREMKSEV